CYGYHGCYASACHGCFGGGHPVAAPTTPPPAPPQRGERLKSPPKPGEDEVNLGTPATLVVHLPAEAKLFVDGTPTSSTSDTRVFASPALQKGKTFFYVLRGELARDGQTLRSEREVQIRAGERTQVEMTFPTLQVAQR